MWNIRHFDLSIYILKDSPVSSRKDPVENNIEEAAVSQTEKTKESSCKDKIFVLQND